MEGIYEGTSEPAKKQEESRRESLAAVDDTASRAANELAALAGRGQPTGPARSREPDEPGL